MYIHNMNSYINVWAHKLKRDTSLKINTFIRFSSRSVLASHLDVLELRSVCFDGSPSFCEEAGCVCEDNRITLCYIPFDAFWPLVDIADRYYDDLHIGSVINMPAFNLALSGCRFQLV